MKSHVPNDVVSSLSLYHSVAAAAAAAVAEEGRVCHYGGEGGCPRRGGGAVHADELV